MIAIADGADYNVDTTDPSITVGVKDNDAPTGENPRVSIAAASTEAVRTDSASTADFIITASDQTTGKDVFVSVSGTGNFITPIAERKVDLSDSQDTTTYPVTITDPTPGSDDPDGSVTVTLLDRAGYTLADAPANVATAVITDDASAPTVPEISISSGAAQPDGTGVTERYSFEFTLQSTSNVSGNLDVTVAITDESNNTLTLRSGGSTVRIQDGEDSAKGIVVAPANSTQINVEVTAVAGSYTVNTADDDIMVTVKDSDTGSEAIPVISFSGPSTVVEGTDATFSITASHDPTNSPLNVKVLVANSAGDDVLADGEAGEQPVPVSTAATPGTLEITTKANAPGSFVVSIVEDANYALPRYINDRDKTTSVIDAPTISISGGTPVNEGGSAYFNLSSSDSSITTNVRVQLSDNDEGFLEASEKTIKTLPVGLFYQLTVPTSINSVTSSNGMITATILADDSTPARYAIGASSPAMVTINNVTPVPLPTASLNMDLETTGVTRGHNFEIIVSLDETIPREAYFAYTIENEGDKAPPVINATGTINVPANQMTGTALIEVDQNHLTSIPADATYKVTIRSLLLAAYVTHAQNFEITIPVHENDTSNCGKTSGIYSSCQL